MFSLFFVVIALRALSRMQPV